LLKKGSRSAGVKRKYSDTAERIENSQVGVFLCYGIDKGATLVDRELYIAQEWAEDRERRSEARIPESLEFATKPELLWRHGHPGCSQRGLRPRRQVAPASGNAAEGLCAGCGLGPALVAVGYLFPTMAEVRDRRLAPADDCFIFHLFQARKICVHLVYIGVLFSQYFWIPSSTIQCL
jgi:hypothetical protein